MGYSWITSRIRNRKKLGISGKEQIEEYGVEKFVKQCKESVFTYVHMWEEMTNKVGYWVDMENPYVTYHNDYIESVWWALKQMWEKGLLYEGHKSNAILSKMWNSIIIT